MDETLDLINEKNEVIGLATRKEVEAAGLLYRSSEIFVFVGGKIAIQQRSVNKSKRPGYFSIVGETVKSGETFEHAAIRGVKEELGLNAKNLRKIGEKIIRDKLYNDNMLMALFVCNGEGKMEIDKSEVEQVILMSEKEIEHFLISREKISPALIEGFKMYKGLV